MARNPKNPGTVRGKKRGSKPEAPGTPKAPEPSAVAGVSAQASSADSVFDALASTYKELEQITGSPPDITRSIEKMLQDGMDPQEIVAGMSSRGVDVSPFLKDAAPPARAAEAPPNNLPAPEAAPVEAVTDLPEPDASTPAPAGPAAGQQKDMFQRSYEALADAGYSEDQILDLSNEDMLAMAIRERPNLFPEFAPASTPEATPAAPVAPEPPAAPAADPRIAQLQAMDFDTAAMSPEEIDLTYQSLVDQGFIQDAAAATPQPDAQQVADSLRTPIMDAIERASDPNAMPGSPPAAGPISIQEQIRMMSGQRPLEQAYRLLSDAGIPDEVLGRMSDEQLMRMAARANSPVEGLIATDAGTAAPAPQQSSILAKLRDQRAAEASVGDALFPLQYRRAAAEAAAGDALFPPQYTQSTPAPPTPAPAATTPPTAGLLDNATPAPLDAGPLEMPAAANPYGPDIYAQIQMATMGPGMPVQTRFSPDVTPAPEPTGKLEMPPGFAQAANDPNVRLATETVAPAQAPPQVMDVGANIPGGVAAAGAPVQWRNSDGTLNAGSPSSRSSQLRSRVIDTLLGTAARGYQPAKLGLLSPDWGKMFSGADGGLVGRTSRFLTSPRTLLTAATLKYLMNSKGGLVGQGGIAGEGGTLREAGKQLMYGSGEPGESQDNDNVDYATNYRAALERLSRPMSSQGQPLALPMVPNNDRPPR